MRLVEPVGERRLQRPAQQVDVASADVGVAVEQPRQDVPPADVDRLVAVEPGADVDDPAVLDCDVARAGSAPEPSKIRPPRTTIRVMSNLPGKRSRP